MITKKMNKNTNRLLQGWIKILLIWFFIQSFPPKVCPQNKAFNAQFNPFADILALTLTEYEVNQAIDQATVRLNELEKTMLGDILKSDEIDTVIVNNAPRVFRKIRLGFISTMAADILKNRLQSQFNKYQLAEYLSSLDLWNTTIGNECPYNYSIYSRRSCNPIYREVDGFCNNLKNPIWGTTYSPVIRFIPPDYGDGLNSLRLAFDGSELPNARLISTTTLPTRIVEDTSITGVVMAFGQLMDHEYALASSPTGFKQGKLLCCNKNSDHPQCLPVQIPPDDYFYSKVNQNCMEVVRSLPAIARNCRLGPRHQNNEATSYIDASQVYGSIPIVSNGLRTFERGLLKTQLNPSNPHGQRLLPLSGRPPASEQCMNKTGPFRCFGSGDERTNENSLLIAMHTVFMREHNRIVDRLITINPQWDDEKLYQEGRRIVAAYIQHISVNELIPILIGDNNVNRFNLELAGTGYFSGYDENIDATVDQGFIVAAFRYGHSLINKDIFRISRSNHFQSPLQLKTDFFRPENIYNEDFPRGLDPLLRGLFQQHAQFMDNNIVEDVKNHLFEFDSRPFGMDLMVLNIMRAREHGVPGYNEWREFCGFSRFTDFFSMQAEMHRGAAENFAKVYKHPDDVDLFPAGVSELSLGGGILGPTFSCIIGLQFHNLRFGDRFWYENFPRPGIINYPFRPEQLQEIRKITLSKIFCENSDTIKAIQRDMFRAPSERNPVTYCNHIPDINLLFWKEH